MKSMRECVSREQAVRGQHGTVCVCVCVCACVVIGYGLELSIMYIYPQHKKIQNVFYSDAFASSAYICVSLGASTHALPYDA